MYMMKVAHTVYMCMNRYAYVYKEVHVYTIRCKKVYMFK